MLGGKSIAAESWLSDHRHKQSRCPIQKFRSAIIKWRLRSGKKSLRCFKFSFLSTSFYNHVIRSLMWYVGVFLWSWFLPRTLHMHWLWPFLFSGCVYVFCATSYVTALNETQQAKICHCRVSNTPGNLLELFFPPRNLLEIYKVSWKFSGLVCGFACLSLILVTILVFQSVSVQNISR